MTILVFTLVAFLAIGVFFLFFHLMLGKLVRPAKPEEDKLTIYECGEPTVGSAWIQFDLRYYVVALLFVIFDVEVAFFFPWATVFGTTNAAARELSASEAQVRAQLIKYAEDDFQKKEAKLNDIVTVVAALEAQLAAAKAEHDARLAWLQGAVEAELRPELAREIYKREFDLGLPPLPNQTKDTETISAEGARGWAWISFVDILIFFGVLMMGFAYLWKRGDIDWVRSTANAPPPGTGPPELPFPHASEQALVGSK